MAEPLAGLDDIDWAGLRHAYGSAEDVPGLLRALSSSDEDERNAALSELFTNIHHQGSRYSASAAAVPFLLALASDPGAPERTWPLYLAVALAIGFDESHLPSGVDITAWREEAARPRATDPADQAHRPDAWVAGLAAYDAVRTGLPTVLHLLGDQDSGVRATAAYAAGWFPEEAATALPALGALLDVEQDPNVIAHALVSGGLLDGRTLIPRLREHMAGVEPLPRWAAAIALARLDAADPPVIAELAARSATPPEEPAAFLNGDLRLYSALTLAALDEPAGDAVDAVLEGLSRTSDDASFPMAAAALKLTFRTPVLPLPPFADLTTAQQRTVRTIAELPSESWQWINLMEILGDWGLPTDRGECRRYAGIG
ncbi:HEAT repeat domain-containing protein [Spirillospora sp. CA-142024]|uniref:HEAT repeat domain-containing protein n=1 Tax=Spirillospora sp. CA-142024 TaxID=3240036 RepID=UPI003D8F417D